MNTAKANNHFLLNDSHHLFRTSLRSFLDAEVIPNIDQWEEDGRIPKSVFKQIGDLGFFQLDFPEKYGGAELDFYYTLIFIEEISKCKSAGFGAAIMAHPILALSHIACSGSDYLKEKYLRAGIEGNLIGGLAITEPFAGSDVANIRTTAVRQGDHFLVNGSKMFITNGVFSDYLIVAVKTTPNIGAAGISLLIIDRNTKGFTAQALNKLGWRSSDTGDIAFDNVKVPVENLIGEEGKGFLYIMQRFALERLVMAIAAVASSEWALNYTLQYMTERKAFGRPLNRFQELRHRVAQLSAEIECKKHYVYHCSRLQNDGVYAVKECSMAKLLSTELADKVATECIQFMGGYGYMEEFPLARHFRDTRLGTIGGGTSEIMCEIISKIVIDKMDYSSLLQ